MRKLLSLLLLIPCSLLAQITEYGSFKIYDREVIYQKVLSQDSITAEKLVEFLKSVPTVGSIQIKDGTVTADLLLLTVDYVKYKFTQASVPSIIQTGKFNGKLIFEIKAGKYRVTLRGIQMKGDMGHQKITEPESITNYVCTDGGTALSKDWSKPSALGLLEQAITDRVRYKETNADWK